MAEQVFHCELAWLGTTRPARDVRIDVRDGRITAVAGDSAPAPGAIHLGGLVLPGLANAHSHAFHRALRGRTHGDGGTFWTWRDRMYRAAQALDPDSYHALARAVFAEMVLAGISCVGEFHYVHHQTDGTPYSDPNAMGDAVLAAAGEAGLRITLLDTCYLGSAIAPDGSLAPVLPAQRRFSDGSAEVWADRVAGLEADGRRARVGAAIHSVRAVDPASMTVVAAWAGDGDRVVHAHVSEQPAENSQCLQAHRTSPLGLLEAAGALSASFTAVHATHVDGSDIDRLATAGAGVCMCPTTERDLADGIGPAGRIREAGVPISLGSDSHAVIDLFEESRAVELDERLTSGERGIHTAADLLAAATEQGHRSLGWPESGRIEPGAIADLVAVTLGSVRTAGTPADEALAAVVFAAAAADVTDVVIGGEHVVASSRHRSIDAAGELERTITDVWRRVEEAT